MQFWTDQKARDFIAAEYPWFLTNFDGYKYPIQRADAIRYFVLAHYGRIYINLDDTKNETTTGLQPPARSAALGHPQGQNIKILANDSIGDIARPAEYERLPRMIPEAYPGPGVPRAQALVWRNIQEGGAHDVPLAGNERRYETSEQPILRKTLPPKLQELVDNDDDFDEPYTV
ncbi:uncharacterized protein CDV56_108931 [Aspergillus thermomutatus]|uniref:Uncharacterized protein n=1 Tax=Aspergillus thermomutatus TaxID=41047 RepID=A0A397HH79_ASPTH|nr:uncharacterized protein CDV56_108931 [Aspergillus thermomutatus]RHZ62481.1 hypothetical protein CDV56_108931 [Aspergillus thermomutatus]